eukprot:c54167_g1_i1.p1 GENE.c54167_g1_i1~~c54167_g1_i1.p1  ORF type:complete len:146 (+),score=8.36 c54167_g1_i1:66-503(+)
MSLVRSGNKRNFLSLFDDAFFSQPLTRFRSSFEDIVAAPKVDVSESEKEYKVVAEVPGYTKDKINVKYEDEVLTISGSIEEKEENKKEGDITFIHKERSESFSRSFRIPNTQSDQISAKFDNGLLTVTLLKKADSAKKDKTIAIQ